MTRKEGFEDLANTKLEHFYSVLRKECALVGKGCVLIGEQRSIATLLSCVSRRILILNFITLRTGKICSGLVANITDS